MLGLMFCGKWVRKCQLCQSYISNPTEHMLLYCSQTVDFQETLWRRLIFRFGMHFFNSFMTESPNGQIELLYSGCSKLLNNKIDVTDCVKIFSTALAKLHVHSVNTIKI